MKRPVQRSPKRRRATPSCEEIARAHRKFVATLPNVWDARRAAKCCWGCGLETAPDASPQRCHIIATSRGGPFEPLNFVLLCTTCHREQPDGQPFEVVAAWLRTRESFIDRTFREFKPVLDTIRERASAAAGGEELVSEWFREASSLGGDPLRAFDGIMRRGMRKAADNRFRAEAANSAWEVLIAFEEWLRARGKAQLALRFPEAAAGHLQRARGATRG